MQAPHRAPRDALADQRSRGSQPQTRQGAPGSHAAAGVGRRLGARREENEAPEPLEHATPDVELAEAQLAVGRPDPADATPTRSRRLEDERDASRTSERRSRLVAAERGHPGQRLVNFAQGSWRELQRVQWPDRRQVVQATSVVIGFVIIAGAFLGVADLLAGHLMNYILTGHFK